VQAIGFFEFPEALKKDVSWSGTVVWEIKQSPTNDKQLISIRVDPKEREWAVQAMGGRAREQSAATIPSADAPLCRHRASVGRDAAGQQVQRVCHHLAGRFPLHLLW